jgi:formylglycine-generating enzyme required for sulfatase activity
MAAWNRLIFSPSIPRVKIHLMYGVLWLIILQVMSVGLCDEVSSQKRTTKNIWKEPNTQIEFIRMAKDCFRMGNLFRGDWYLHEQPRRKVCLSSYYMGVTEVTNAQYRKFKPEHKSSYSNDTLLNEAQLPVVNVTLADAKAFAKWLTQKHKGAYHFRLPTEAEWENACREGLKTEQYWIRGKNDSCLYANLRDHSPSHLMDKRYSNECIDEHMFLAPVGSYLPNKFGLYDMLGNAWEWCADSYNIYAYRKLPRNDPVYTKNSDYHAIRGGGWQSAANDTRCSKRKYTVPKSQFESVGFRLVMTRSP